MKCLGIQVDPTVTFDEYFNPNDNDKITDSRCAYFNCSDTEPSSSDTEQYVDYVDDFSYISSHFNCDEETWFPTSLNSIEGKDAIDSPTISVKIKYDNDRQIYFTDFVSIQTFFRPFEQRYYLTSISSMTSLFKPLINLS